MNQYNGFSPRQRARALHWLNRQYAAGRRQRPTKCDLCGQTEGLIEAHSEDYSEPFGAHIGAAAVCYRCHMALHCRHKAPEAWARYQADIAAGVRFAPFLTRNWFAFRAQHLTAYSPALSGSSR